MSAISVYCKNSETSHHHRILLNLTDKIDLKRKTKYIGLSNLSIYYTWENIKMSYKNSYLKFQLHHAMKNLNYLMDHIL